MTFHVNVSLFFGIKGIGAKGKRSKKEKVESQFDATPLSTVIFLTVASYEINKYEYIQFVNRIKSLKGTLTECPAITAFDSFGLSDINSSLESVSYKQMEPTTV